MLLAKPKLTNTLDAKEFETIDLHFDLIGDLDKKKVERALDLTFTKYCSVAISLSDKIKINYNPFIVLFYY